MFVSRTGILFYLANTFAASMYILGAIELLLVYMAPGMSMFGELRPFCFFACTCYGALHNRYLQGNHICSLRFLGGSEGGNGRRHC
jgi:hypothetical protein